MKTTGRFRWHLFIRIAICCALLVSLSRGAFASERDEERPLSLMEETWKEFRGLHPHGLQTVALKHCADTCVFVISEPPPTVDASQLGTLFAEHGGRLIVCTQAFGLDGFRSDAVGCARLDSTAFRGFEKKLFGLLFGTEYKPFYTDLDRPGRQVCFSPFNLNLRTGSIDWEKWSEGNLFMDSQGRALTVDDILSTSPDSTQELMFGQERGYVAWRIGTRAQNPACEESFRINARHFALDTDLILHAFSNDRCVVIIGRERRVPVTVLPPLRGETICQLAGFSGSPASLYLNAAEAEYVGDEAVWVTPIVSDARIRDTELGNLMLVCDLILKSWSENGHATESFIRYPRPATFMSGNGVAQELGSAPDYQWSACPLMTGSPMPAYLVPGKKRLSELASVCISWQEYFAGQNCVELVRLVQYMMLSQAFGSMEAMPVLQGTGRRWLKTPTYSVSNAKWGQGGCSIGSAALPSANRQGPVRILQRGGKVAISGTAALGRSFYQVPRIYFPPIPSLPSVPGGIPPLPRVAPTVPPRVGLSPVVKISPVVPTAPSIRLSPNLLPTDLPEVTGQQAGLQQRGFIPGLHDVRPALEEDVQQPEETGDDHSLLKAQEELRAKLLRLKGKMDVEAIRSDIIIIAFIQPCHTHRTYLNNTYAHAA